MKLETEGMGCEILVIIGVGFVHCAVVPETHARAQAEAGLEVEEEEGEETSGSRLQGT